MNSQDRLKAIVIVWLIFGLMVGIMCNVGGTQPEEVILSLLLAVIVLAATMHLSDPDAAGRLLARKLVEKPDQRRKPDLLDRLTDDELDMLRERLIAENRHAESRISTFSPPFD